MKISYNWLKSYVPAIPEANKLADVFTYHLAEVESVETLANGDTLFDINILPNRAHDLLSHQGIAKELAGLLGVTFSDPTPMYKTPEAHSTKLVVENKTEKCRRYMGKIVRGVKIGPSPAWVVEHLESIGQRSINNVVDATNIVMFDCGQPCHAFDLHKLQSEKIVIQNAAQGEKITLLTGEEKELLDTDMVISDGVHSLAIAGVKGGKHAEVDGATTDILLEVANFDPVSVRKTARRLGILTDSAKRFENDLSPTLGDFAMHELVALIFELFPDATFEDIVDVYPAPITDKKTISFSVDAINTKIGTQVSAADIATTLKQYSFEFTENGGEFVLTVPPLRLDLTNISDVAEEIARVIGYDKVVPVLPSTAFAAERNETAVYTRSVREHLLAQGYSEVMTYSFCKKGKVEVARGPKGAEFLRTNLKDGLMKSHELNRLNAPLLGVDEIKIFETGTVFPEKGIEEIHVAFADKKGVQEFLLAEFVQTHTVTLIEKPIARTSTQVTLKFTPWSQFPFISRDIAVWVPEGTSPSTLIQIFKEHGTDLLATEPRLFDQFTKEKNTSFAFRLVFQSKNRTLTDAEVESVVENIYSTLKTKGYTVR